MGLAQRMFFKMTPGRRKLIANSVVNLGNLVFASYILEVVVRDRVSGDWGAILGGICAFVFCYILGTSMYPRTYP